MKPHPMRPIMHRLLLVSAGVFLLWDRSTSATEPPWTEIHAQHFVVLTDAGEKRGRELALRFEQMRSLFAGLLMKNRLNMSEPLNIIALKNDQQYLRAAPVHDGRPIGAPGFLVLGADRNFIVLDLAEDEPWRGVAHDFALLLLQFNYPPTQAWFDEGLAEYFSSARLDDKQVEIGGDPELVRGSRPDLSGNAPAAQQFPSQRDTQKSLTELLLAPAWLSITDLFTMKHDTWGNTEGTRNTPFYAQSWMVMHYLINRKLLPETGTYFELVQNQKLPVDQAIQKAYDKSPAQLEAAVKEYCRSLAPLSTRQDAARPTAPRASHGEVYQLPAPVGPNDAAMTTAQVPAPDALALLADVMARMPEHRAQALRDLHTLATEPTNTEAAHRAMAWIDIEKKDFKHATQELETAAELNPRDPWVPYYLSLMKYHMAQANHQETRGLANMMQDLRTVLDWNPEFAEAYNMLAMARVEGGGNNSALESIRAAIQLSPRNEHYVYNLGLIYASGKKWEAAQAVFERLRSSANREIAAAAREQLNELATVQKYGISATPTPKPAPPTQSALNQPPVAKAETNTDNQGETELTEKSQAPALPQPTGPIQFLKGKLVGVDCSQSPAAVLTVTTGAKTLKLRTLDYKSLTLIGADNFSCDWRNRPVSVNYRASGKSEGNLVSLEVQ